MRLLAKLKRAERDLSLPLAGERIVIGVSGGWDSLALLCVLEEYRRTVRNKPELFAVYTAFQGDAAVPPPLSFLRFMGGRDVPFITVVPPEPPSSCPHCRFRRREYLLRAARGLSARVVALGHHLEDYAETLLLNLLYGGSLEGLAPALNYFGRFAVVRPLLYATRKEIRALGRALGFPPPPPHCALSRDSRRMVLRGILEELTRGNRHVLASILRVGLEHGNRPELPGQSYPDRL